MSVYACTKMIAYNLKGLYFVLLTLDKFHICSTKYYFSRRTYKVSRYMQARSIRFIHVRNGARKFSACKCTYSLRPIENDVSDSVLSCLTVRLIQNVYINIIYFVMTYFIIRDTLIIMYLFYNL
jgi:hypothetical protein